MRGIFWVTGDLWAPQEGLGSMELVIPTVARMVDNTDAYEVLAGKKLKKARFDLDTDDRKILICTSKK